MNRVSLLLVCALAACAPATHDAEAPDWEPGAADVQPAPGDMTLTATPLVGGLPATITVSDAPPGATVFLLFSSSIDGPGACPPPLTPDCLDIPAPVNVLTSRRADGDGVARFDLVVPDPVPLPAASFQAASPEDGDNHTSNALVLDLWAPDSDADGDGLSAAEELELGTDLLVFDTDGGGVGDGDEVAAGTDPLDPSDDVGERDVDTLVAGDLIVTEFMANPQIVDDANAEWIEIHSMLDRDIDLAGLEIADRDSDSYTVAGPLMIPAGGYVVLARSADMGINGGLVVDEAYGGEFVLANSVDEIVLRRPDGGEIFALEYDSGPWPITSGSAAQLPPGGDPAVVEDWCDAWAPYGDGDNNGTPGAENTDCTPPITYTANVEPILASYCYSCHGGAGMSGGVNFDTYDELFQPSVDVPSIQLITPFLLDESYLYQKVNGTPGDVGGGGSRMPLVGGPLLDDEITLIADWILGGALE